MHVTYFDEVKANPNNGQKYYFVGEICVPMVHIPEIEAAVSALSKDLFGSTELIPATEFHASHIYFGKGVFRGMPCADRIAILIQLAAILTEGDRIRRVYAAIDTTKLYNSTNAAEFAFAHFYERVQLLVGRKENTLLIGDLDDEQAKHMIAAFSRFRANGTPWQYGVEVTSIVDSVHFARSHHSRMIQLADAYLFILSHGFGSRSGWMADALREELKKFDFFPHRYKIWPNER